MEWRNRRRHGVLIVALTVPAFIIAMQLYAGYRAARVPVSFAALFVIQLCHWELWAVFGPFVWSLGQRWPLDASRRLAAIVRHAVAALLTAVVVLVLYLLLYHILIRVPILAGWFTGLDRSLSATSMLFFVTTFHVDVLVYCGIVAAAHASRMTALLRAREQDTFRLEAELVRAKLTTLRTQLQPHFLFNTLHTIGSLVLQRENDRAVHLLAELGELLRGALAHRDTDLAPLGEELSYLRRYLQIELARFGDRLTIEWVIEPAAEDALIPPFILQPIVENAFRHGISQRTDASSLCIGASLEAPWLRLTVYNDGPLLAPTFSPHAQGYGLKNVTERLSTRKPAGQVEFTNETAGVRVTLLLPLLRAEGERSTT